MPGIGVISNPLSLRNRRNPKLVKRLAYILGEKGELAQPKDFDHLDEVARSFRDHDVDIVCIHGGDGTVHKALSALYRAYKETFEGDDDLQMKMPMIAILKGGTMNTMAKNVGVKMKAEAMLGHVVSGYHSDEPWRLAERNLVVVDGQNAGFLFGTGVLARFLEAYYERGSGTWAAIRTLAVGGVSAAIGGKFIKWLWRYDRVKVEVDGEFWPHPAYASVGIGTAADIGLGFKVFHRALKHPDHMAVLGAACSAWTLVTVIPKMLWSGSIRRHDIPDQVGKRVVISGEEPVDYMMDGDFVKGGQTLVVTVGPRLRFIVG